LYQGVEFAHALFMIGLARGFGFFKRLLMLSATPDPEAADILERAIGPTLIDCHQLPRGADIKGESVVGAPPATRTAVHEVRVTPVQYTGGDPVEVLLSEIIALKPEIERLRATNPGDEYLPAVVIVNSVISAIRLEERLVEKGFSRGSIVAIRGLSNRAIRDTRGKLLALGTSAIEVGVDFHCDLLFFEASDAASFLQRFGRVGRHRAGRAIAIVPPNAFSGMMALGEVDREDFEQRIYSWYPSAASRPWFAATESGMITVRALAENLFRTVQGDGRARREVLADLREKLESILSEHAARLGCVCQNVEAKRMFDRCRAGSKHFSWLIAYQNLNRFRTSLVSVKVHDFTEQNKRGEWRLGQYEADVATLLRRAVGMAWNEKLGLLTIRGIGKYHRVHASEIFADEDTENILQTKDYATLRLWQDGESTPISDVMARQNHVFTVIPKGIADRLIDWRIPVFEAGKYLVAFDGAALLLTEIYKRGNGQASSAVAPQP
ncbi:MAG: hypothetical protein ACREDR_28900, partial [Blastocatellia bacterium]